MITLQSIKAILEVQFPEYEITIGKRIYRKCIIVNKSKYRGVDIFIYKSKIIVEPAIPEMKTRLLIGAGVLFLKSFKKDFSEPANRILVFLKSENFNAKLRV